MRFGDEFIPMTEGFSISIVVACRNEAGHIRALLDSILKQDLYGYRWEAIVADGMSDDGTWEILQQYCENHLQIRAIRNPGRIASTGLNAGIRAAVGEIVLRMDAHTDYAPDYCRRCVETLLETGADNVGGPARTKATGRMARAIAAAYHSPFSTGGAHFHDVNYCGWVDTVTYGCWYKRTLEHIGLFDESLVRNQDDELNLRLIRKGGRIWQSPDIVSWYSSRASISALFRQYFQYGYWKVRVIQKHRLPGSVRHLIPVAFVLFHILAAMLMFMVLIGGQRRAALWIAGLWIAGIGAYAAVNMAASVITALHNEWDTLVYLPVIFGAYHSSYGLGFLAGLLRQRRQVNSESMFARITR
jgi:glycosyltransferase involved in cell wall biosynthesis